MAKVRQAIRYIFLQKGKKDVATILNANTLLHLMLIILKETPFNKA